MITSGGGVVPMRLLSNAGPVGFACALGFGTMGAGALGLGVGACSKTL